MLTTKNHFIYIYFFFCGVYVFGFYMVIISPLPTITLLLSTITSPLMPVTLRGAERGRDMFNIHGEEPQMSPNATKEEQNFCGHISPYNDSDIPKKSCMNPYTTQQLTAFSAYN